MGKHLYGKRFIFCLTQSDRFGLEQLVNTYNEPASVILRRLIREAVIQLDEQQSNKRGGDK